MIEKILNIKLLITLINHFKDYKKIPNGFAKTNNLNRRKHQG